MMKTSAGVEIINTETKLRKTETERDSSYEQRKEPTITPIGMSKEAAELYNDLEKWSFSSLKTKFVERIQTHLRSNPISRDQLLADLNKFDQVFKI